MTRAPLQFVWWGWPQGFGFERARGSMRAVYRWFLFLGPLEIRRWEPDPAAGLADARRQAETP